ncbi:MAG: DNA polymerase IV [Proteobacteria bacterium]|nr:DNA polymerase IV [Pseudomonadota bacterium]
MAQTWILHIDMDAFFASVEQLDNPELRGKPVAVGGTSDRGVISAASYEIRKFGVRSAMPAVTARRLCPHGIFLPGRMYRYKEKSREVMAVLGGFSPLVEQASVDEAYLDATGLERLFGPIEELGRAIKARVKEVTGLTCSVGAAPVRFLAKIASDMDKPDGLYTVHPHQIESFLQQLPVGKIPGVGAKGLDTLSSYGVQFASDLLRHPEAFWVERLGKLGPVLYAKAQGIDPTGVLLSEGPKSCSAENTFSRDLKDRETLSHWLLKQADRVAADLRRHKVEGRTVTLKAKFNNFKQITRSRSLKNPTSDTRTIHAEAVKLLDELDLPLPLRLIGLGVSNFERRPRQLSLLEDQEPKRNKQLESAVDEVRKRFGTSSLKRATLKDFEG